LPEPEADYQEEDGTERLGRPSTILLYLDTMKQDGELEHILKA